MSQKFEISCYTNDIYQLEKDTIYLYCLSNPSIKHNDREPLYFIARTNEELENDKEKVPALEKGYEIEFGIKLDKDLKEMTIVLSILLKNYMYKYYDKTTNKILNFFKCDMYDIWKVFNILPNRKWLDI